jgi:hypothetical protein
MERAGGTTGRTGRTAMINDDYSYIIMVYDEIKRAGEAL